MWKKIGARGRKRGRLVHKKRGLCRSRLATTSRRPASTRSLTDRELAPSFHFFWFFWFFFFLVVWGWAWHFGRMGEQHPHFLKLAPILGRVKSSILHGAWRFHFFSNFFFAKFTVDLDLHIHCWDFCFMKK
jgi:hypothetical protein